MFKNLAFYNN